jgi:UTP:GlnB (protein PII) uridylyltransferase
VIETHVDTMPGEYLRSASSDEVIWHVDLIEGLEGGADLDTRPGRAADTAVIVGRDPRELRRVVAETLAANGVDVLEARLLSRADGVVVDTFRVRDDRTGGSVPPERWDQIREDVNSAMAGQLDTGSKLAERAAAYSVVRGPRVETRVDISIDGASDIGVVRVKCADRVGRLAEILNLLRDSGLEILLAKLDTREGEVIDTFHVKAASLPSDEAGLGELEGRIESSIRP